MTRAERRRIEKEREKRQERINKFQVVNGKMLLSMEDFRWIKSELKKEAQEEVTEELRDEYDENIRIGLWLPPTRSLMANRNRREIDSSLAMNKWLISTYDGREDENIYLVPVYLNVDPYHDYQASEVPVSSRNSDFTMVVDSDVVHPATAGYKKIADVIYSYIKYFANLDEAE